MVSQVSHQQEVVYISEQQYHSTQHQTPIIQQQQSIDAEHNQYNVVNIAGKTVSPPPNIVGSDNEKYINGNDLNTNSTNGQNAIYHTHGIAIKRPKKRIVLEVLSVVYGENNQPVFFVFEILYKKS